jgi:hypothetical protein
MPRIEGLEGGAKALADVLQIGDLEELIPQRRTRVGGSGYGGHPVLLVLWVVL